MDRLKSLVDEMKGEEKENDSNNYLPSSNNNEYSKGLNYQNGNQQNNYNDQGQNYQIGQMQYNENGKRKYNPNGQDRGYK